MLQKYPAAFIGAIEVIFYWSTHKMQLHLPAINLVLQRRPSLCEEAHWRYCAASVCSSPKTAKELN